MSEPRLEDLLTQQLARLGQLLALLEQETDALVKRDVERIEALLKEKLTLLEAIAEADQALGRHRDVARLTEEPALAEQLKAGQALLAQCQSRNEHNQAQAELVSASLTRLQQLMQRTRHASAMTYTGEGQTHVGQRLGKRIQV
ncbi:flagellar export chaperone FlgN [Ferrimonas balearica]|uniref:flagellar export chaperone FlgN n=1 Tax=Ferrimonas balearica TaxID=44012 RepID=UPI001C998501|nr:flagellar export chaperone FlgN [Ferrimonas balearica]MBY5992924.1 flagellar protein FlgN [Ferrimonas balearica]